VNSRQSRETKGLRESGTEVKDVERIEGNRLKSASRNQQAVIDRKSSIQKYAKFSTR